MSRKIASGIMFTLLLIGMSTLLFSIQVAEASGIHDVAVTAVETFMHGLWGETYPINVVFDGQSLNINAIVENQGDFNETFNVTAEYNGSTIQAISDFNLTAYTSTNVMFMWDTTGVAKEVYTITVEASVVPEETETADNTFSGVTVTVTLMGDFDGNFDIDEDDLWYFCAQLVRTWIPEWPLDPRIDFDGNGWINEDDLWTFCWAFIDYYRTKWKP